MHFNYTRICQVCISDKSCSTISESLALISSTKKKKKNKKKNKDSTARITWTIRNVFLQTFSRTYPCECAVSSALIGHTFMTLWRHIQASRLLTRHHDFYLRLMPFLCSSNFIHGVVGDIASRCGFKIKHAVLVCYYFITQKLHEHIFV